MRGKDHDGAADFARIGITPAYAGKSVGKSALDSYSEDHPRLCGEKVVGFEYRLAAVGSPPPMRGKEIESGRGKSHQGITPAYAGKRSG